MTEGTYTYKGVLGSSEVFAHSWSWHDNDTITAATAAGAGVVWLTNWLVTANAKLWFSPTVVWNSVRTVTYDATGEQVDAVDTPITPIAGTTTAGLQLPFEVSSVVTLRTAVNDRNSRGRFYLPPTTTQQLDGQTGLYTTGMYAGTGSNSLLDKIAGAFSAFKDATRFPIVISRTNAGAPVYAYHEVTSIELGNVPDAQRRRRNRLVETRGSIGI